MTLDHAYGISATIVRMKAIRMSRTGEPDVLEYVDLPTPVPAPRIRRCARYIGRGVRFGAQEHGPRRAKVSEWPNVAANTLVRPAH